MFAPLFIVWKKNWSFRLSLLDCEKNKTKQKQTANGRRHMTHGGDDVRKYRYRSLALYSVSRVEDVLRQLFHGPSNTPRRIESSTYAKHILSSFVQFMSERIWEETAMRCM